MFIGAPGVHQSWAHPAGFWSSGTDSTSIWPVCLISWNFLFLSIVATHSFQPGFAETDWFAQKPVNTENAAQTQLLERCFSTERKKAETRSPAQGLGWQPVVQQGCGCAAPFPLRGKATCSCPLYGSGWWILTVSKDIFKWMCIYFPTIWWCWCPTSRIVLLRCMASDISEGRN